MIPKRADPVAGSLFATIVLGVFLAPLVLIGALLVWLMVRSRRSKLPGDPVDAEFGSRFHELEDDILDAETTKPERSRRRRRQVRDQ